MKKLILGVAFLATALTVGAKSIPTFTFFDPASVTQNGSAVTATVSVATAGSSATFTSSVGGSATLTYEAASTSAPSYEYKTSAVDFHIYENAGTTTNDSVKLYSRFLIPNKSTLKLGAFTTTGGKIYASYAPNGTSARGLSITIKGNIVVTFVPTAAFTTKYEYVTVSADIPAGTYAAGDVIITAATNTILLYGVSIDGVTTSTSDAISSDLLSKQGDVLVNNVGEVKIVSALGATVLSSSDASINISGLPSGVYVAVTEQGTLKFVK